MNFNDFNLLLESYSGCGWNSFDDLFEDAVEYMYNCLDAKYGNDYDLIISNFGMNKIHTMVSEIIDAFIEDAVLYCKPGKEKENRNYLNKNRDKIIDTIMKEVI